MPAFRCLPSVISKSFCVQVNTDKLRKLIKSWFYQTQGRTKISELEEFLNKNDFSVTTKKSAFRTLFCVDREHSPHCSKTFHTVKVQSSRLLLIFIFFNQCFFLLFPSVVCSESFSKYTCHSRVP